MDMIVLEKFPEIEDNIHCQVYDIHDLRQKFPEWEEFSRKEKAVLCKKIDPIQESSSHNVTCRGLHRYIVDNLDTNQAINEAATHLALGDDNTTPQSSNTDLNNEVGRFSVTSTFDNGASLDTTTFLDTSEGNGNTFKEVGLVNQSSSSGDILFNHSTISSIAKTSEKVVTIDVTLNVAFEGSTTAISVSDDGTAVVSDVSDINFSTGLTASDDGDGTTTAKLSHVDYADLRRVF